MYMSVDKEFNVIIIKPNICSNECTTDHFEENVFSLLKHNDKHNTYNDLKNMNNILTSYLSKKDYIAGTMVTLETLCKTFEKFINPNDDSGRRYEVKTCLNNDEEMIMFLYDYSLNRYPNTFNHLATILCPGMESIFGPVFITKIKKTTIENKECLEHVDLTVSDIVNLWFSTKQITYWNYDMTDGWTLQNMFNNNIGLDASKYIFAHINENIVFFKLNEGVILEDEISNIFRRNNPDELNKYFVNIKICKLRTGEYANEQLKYNPDIANANVAEQIGKIALNAFEDQGKYQVHMEAIFQNASKQLKF